MNWSKFVNFIYKTYVLFGTEISNPVKVVTFFLLAILNVIFFYNNLQPSLTGLVIADIVYVLCVVIHFVSDFFIQKLIKNLGGRFLFNNSDPALNISDGKLKIDMSSSCDLTLNFAGSYSTHSLSTDEIKANGELSGQLNAKAFSKTRWQAAVPEKTKRNYSHIQKSGKTILLFKDDNKDVGFSHILPANLYNWYRYKEGGIADADFNDDLIVPENIKYKDDEPFGLIIFTVAITQILKTPKEKNYKEEVGKILSKIIAFHLNEFCANEFKYYQEIPVMIQTMDIKLILFLKEQGIKPTGFSSDGARIFCFPLINPHPVLIPKCEKTVSD